MGAKRALALTGHGGDAGKGVGAWRSRLRGFRDIFSMGEQGIGCQGTRGIS